MISFAAFFGQGNLEVSKGPFDGAYVIQMPAVTVRYLISPRPEALLSIVNGAGNLASIKYATPAVADASNGSAVLVVHGTASFQSYGMPNR
jgi:hypothetical protein